MSLIDPRDRLIVALDLPSVSAAEAMVARLGDAVSFYKIGMELTYGGGLGLARELAKSGKKIFLDLKLHDIPNTVAAAIMAKHAVALDDLFTAITPQLATLQNPNDVHFTSAGYGFLGREVAAAVSSQLK